MWPKCLWLVALLVLFIGLVCGDAAVRGANVSAFALCLAGGVAVSTFFLGTIRPRRR